ncbi:hypothetical protein HDV06_000208 [Boothiomyces sp. JEL0866]|nr:hypothetical protein HDV06_000208 [Boothiomyces sp. JEL0866]
MKVAVLGGGSFYFTKGISGLSAAYFLALRKAKVTLITGKQRGGWVQTIYRNKEYIETGPRSLRPVGNAAFVTLEMIHDLGLEKEILGIPGTSPAAQNRFVFYNGTMNNLSSDPIKMLTSNQPILKGFIPALLTEAFKPKSTTLDESIHSFVSRRLGTSIADNMVSAVIHGIYAGDIKKLSIRSTMNFLYTLEKKYGSITKGMLASLVGKKDQPYKANNPEAQAFIEKIKKFKIYTFARGMQVLTDSLEEKLKQLGVEIIPEKCVGVQFDKSGVRIHTETRKIDSEKVICTIPSRDLSKIVTDSALQGKLSSIPSVTVGVVNLVYKGDVLKAKGFGFLVPQSEAKNLDIIGVVYDSCAFPEHSVGSEVTTRMTVMMGGHAFEGKFGNPDNVKMEDLLEISKKSVEQVLGISRDLLIDSYVSIQKNCIPQYYVGHEDKVQDIRSHLAKVSHGRFVVTGASFNGVSVNDCIYNSQSAAIEVTFE